MHTKSARCEQTAAAATDFESRRDYAWKNKSQEAAEPDTVRVANPAQRATSPLRKLPPRFSSCLHPQGVRHICEGATNNTQQHPQIALKLLILCILTTVSIEECGLSPAASGCPPASVQINLLNKSKAILLAAMNVRICL